MESALDVLSRAATMVQDNANESRLTTKELPTTKWRRDRRLRATEYQQQSPVNNATISGMATSTSSTPPPPLPPATAGATPAQQQLPPATHVAPPPLPLTHSSTAPMSVMMAAAAAAAAASSMRPLCESTNRPSAHHSPAALGNSLAAHNLSHESPIDMSVTSTTMKPRASPPPPYREPLPGSTYATSLARPSVITQAPPKRGNSSDARDNMLISNRENDNRSSESISMCETVIDEHFRRSLGADYVALFSKKSPAPTTPSPQPMPPHGATSTAALSSPPPHMAHIYTPTTTLQQTLPPQHHYQHSPPPPPPSHHHTHLHHLQHLQHPQALIAPKPTAMLLSPTIAAQNKTDLIQQHSPTTLPPPQQQPLALQRNAASSITLSPQQQLVQRKAISAKSPAASPTTSSSSPRPLSPTPATVSSNAAVSTAPSSPQQSQQQSPTMAHSPAFMRIKTEPGITLAATNLSSSPPASPASSSSVQSETPSVDDHFAKALGDTWKKLQQNKELKK